VAAVSSFNGGGGAQNTGRMFITLKARGERLPMKQVVEGLRRKLREVAGITVFMRPIQNLQLGGRQSKAQYQYILQSVRADELNDWANKLQERLRGDPLFRDVTSDAQLRALQAQLHIDRDRANTLGVSIESVRSALFSAFGDRQVSTIYLPTDSYQVIMEVTPEAKLDERALGGVYVRSPTPGSWCRCPASPPSRAPWGPTAINHVGQLQAVTVSFNLAPGTALGDATAKIDKAREAIALPASVITRYGGDAAVFKSSQGSQAILIVAALLVIYVLLGVLYESYIHPITILAGLPSAAVGALATLMLFGQDLTLIAMIGILLLIGIVKKNAIMMIDFALDAQRHHGASAPEAIREACILRFRPIMMTTLAALMGALAHCPGHRRRRRTAPAPGPGGGGRAGVLAGRDALHHTGHLSAAGSLQRPRAGDDDPGAAHPSPVRCRPRRAGAVRSCRRPASGHAVQGATLRGWPIGRPAG
jgi:HAE1 family hydrophobic/amphiphilic exporter-1